MYMIRFEIFFDSKRIPDFEIRDSIITNEWVGTYEDLSFIGGISKCLRITDHTSIEDSFSAGVSFVSEAFSSERDSIFKYE